MVKIIWIFLIGGKGYNRDWGSGTGDWGLGMKALLVSITIR
jgi:hypothetical protein